MIPYLASKRASEYPGDEEAVGSKSFQSGISSGSGSTNSPLISAAIQPLQRVQVETRDLRKESLPETAYTRGADGFGSRRVQALMKT